MLRFLKLGLVMLILPIIASCSYFSSDVRSLTKPPSKKNAEYFINNKVAALPSWVRISGDSYHVVLEKRGYRDVSIDLVRRRGEWFINNNALGTDVNRIGIAVDFDYGNIYQIPQSTLLRKLVVVDNVLTSSETIGERSDTVQTILYIEDSANAYSMRERMGMKSNLDDSNSIATLTKRYTVVQEKSLVNIDVGLSPKSPLLYAASRGQLDALARSIEVSTLSINTVDALGNTALMYALANNQYETATFLIEQGADIFRTNARGQTALMYAVVYSHEDVVEMLLRLRASPNSKDNQEMSVLAYASYRGDSDIVNLLIASGAQIDTVDAQGRTPLMIAASVGNSATANILASYSTDIETRDNNGRTALSLASYNDNVFTMRTLVNYGANLETKDNQGNTPLMLAVMNNSIATAREALNDGAMVDIVNSDGNTPLMVASSNGFLDMVRLVIENKPNPLTQNNERSTAYDIAEQNGYPVIQNILSEYYSQLTEYNAMMFDGANTGNIAKVQRALRLGASPDIVDNETGNTAIFLAIAQDQYGIVSMLVDAGANLNTQNVEGNTPLILAASRDSLTIVNLLLKNGANPNIYNIAGDSPLIWGVTNNNQQLVQQLLVYGADVTHTNDAGFTARRVAGLYNSVNIVSILEAAGAFN